MKTYDINDDVQVFTVGDDDACFSTYLVLGVKEKLNLPALDARFKEMFPELLYPQSSKEGYSDTWWYLPPGGPGFQEGFGVASWEAQDAVYLAAQKRFHSEVGDQLLHRYTINLDTPLCDIGCVESDVLSISDAIRWLWNIFPGCVVWYGKTDFFEPPSYAMTKERLAKLWKHSTKQGA